MIKLRHFAVYKFVKNKTKKTTLVYKENQQNQNTCDRLGENNIKMWYKICAEMLIIHKDKRSKASTINQYIKI